MCLQWNLNHFEIYLLDVVAANWIFFVSVFDYVSRISETSRIRYTESFSRWYFYNGESAYKYQPSSHPFIIIVIVLIQKAIRPLRFQLV